MRLMAGELRWLESKDRALQRKMLSEARKLEVSYYKTRGDLIKPVVMDVLTREEEVMMTTSFRGLMRSRNVLQLHTHSKR